MNEEEGRALDEGEDDEGEQVTSGGGDTEGSDRTHDDTPPPDEGAGEEGLPLSTQSGGSGGGERSEPGGHDRPQ